MFDVSTAALDTARRYGRWHDRAVLHFLVDPTELAAYLRVLRATFEPGGAVILATFAPDDSCSGISVHRCSPDDLVALPGDGCVGVASCREAHITPAGTPGGPPGSP